MAIYHLSVMQVKRSKGQSAVAAAAYRAGEKLYDERLDQTQDYTRKRGVVLSEILFPAGSPAWTREELWNNAEAAERQYNGQPAREVRLGLPHELTDAQRADLVFDFVNDAFVSKGMIADVSIHAPDRHGDGRNHHAHILLTMRELDGDVFAKTKQREWNKSELVEDWREQWEVYQNRALEDAGSDARVDHRTLEAQGIDRDPTQHLGKEATAMEREGMETRIGDENREVVRQQAELDGLRGELAEIDAEVKRQLLTPRLPEEPGKKGLRYVEWYAMQPEPLEQDKPPSFPTAQPEETQDTSLSDRLPYIREQEAHIREHGKVAERGNETMLVEIATLAEMYEMYADLDEGDYKPEERIVGKENREDTSLSDRLPYIKDFEQQIRESGEVTQRGGLGNWYSKTADLAVRAYDYVRDYVAEVVETVKGYWQQREEAKQEQEQDKDMDFDRW